MLKFWSLNIFAKAYQELAHTGSMKSFLALEKDKNRKTKKFIEDLKNSNDLIKNYKIMKNIKAQPFLLFLQKNL